MWRKALLALSGALAALAAVELGVRLLVADPAARVHFATHRGGCCRLDPRLLWTFVPDRSGSWGTEEFTETVHINALGLRGPELGERRPGELRVVAAGDSFTYGHGMSDERAYPAVLQSLLRARGVDATVLNAGTPGYSFDQAYRAVLERWLALEPDAVVAGVHCSDVGHDADMSLYELEGDGRLVEIPTGGSWVLLQGRVLHALPRPLAKLASVRLLAGGLQRADPFGRVPHDAQPAVGTWLRRKIVAELEDLARRGRERGFAVLAVVMPCKPDLVEGDRKVYGGLAEQIAASGVPWVDAGAALRARGVRGEDVFFARDSHLDEDGNRLLADVVADALAPLLDSSPPQP